MGRIGIAFSLGILAVVAVAALAGVHGSIGARAQDADVRYGETVVLPGAELTAFAGATPDELWVWTWHGGGWHLLPSQLDERAPTGEYVASEDGVLDENDEIVFPLDLDGALAPGGAWPPGIERTHPPAVVRVTDPLDAAFEAHAYLFLSRQGPEIAIAPLITFDSASLELRSDAYVLGFADSVADGFAGYKRLSLFGSDEDLLDRLKIRIMVTFNSIEQIITEEELYLIPDVDLPGLTPDPVIVGPVRIVLAADGSALAYQTRFTLTLEGLREISPPAGFELRGVRASLDWSEAALGGTYRDANVPDGVTIDGQADSVPDSPVPAWRETGTDDGRLVVLSHLQGAAGSARTYYKDDATIDTADTGDGRSYGDSGVSAEDVDDFVDSGFPGELVAVPRSAGVTAAQLSEHAVAPLQIEVSFGLPPDTATTPAQTATPTAPPETPIATVTGTASATVTPTATATATQTVVGAISPTPTPTPTGPTATTSSPTDEPTPTLPPEWAHSLAVPLCFK
jgi:hypothetical protein